MAGYIEDRWFKRGPVDPETGKKTRVPTTLHGTGMRYKVTGIPGVRARSFPDKKLGDAKAWLADAQSKSRAGEFVDPRAGNILLREYVETHWWPTRTGDPATLETIEDRVWTHILPHLGDQPLNTIRVPQLRAWLATVSDSISPGTVGAAWGYLSTILQSAVEDERIPRNYCKSSSVGPPKPPERKARAWSRDRVLAVRAAMRDRYRIVVDLGVGAGLRQGEVFGLAVEDIDEDAGVLHIRRQIKKVGGKLVFAPPKGGKSRVVPLPRHLAERLAAHLEAFPAKKSTLPWVNSAAPQTERQAKEWAPRTYELVVTSPWGHALRRDSWNRREWKPTLSAAGVLGEGVERKQVRKSSGKVHKVMQYEESREDGLHALRHTFASVMLDAREPIVAVSRWMGHADPSITLRIYAHMMPEADGRGRAAMDSWFEAVSTSNSLGAP